MGNCQSKCVKRSAAFATAATVDYPGPGTTLFVAARTPALPLMHPEELLDCMRESAQSIGLFDVFYIVKVGTEKEEEDLKCHSCNGKNGMVSFLKCGRTCSHVLCCECCKMLVAHLRDVKNPEFAGTFVELEKDKYINIDKYSDISAQYISFGEPEEFSGPAIVPKHPAKTDPATVRKPAEVRKPPEVRKAAKVRKDEVSEWSNSEILKNVLKGGWIAAGG